MRRWIAALGLFAIAAAVGWLLWRKPVPTGTGAAEFAPVKRATAARVRPSAQAAILPGKPRTLHGRILGPDGPVAGALVTLLSMQDTLAGRDCQCTMACHQKLLACHCDDAAHEVAKAIAARSGEAAPAASVTAAADGAFEFGDLAKGAYTLWAEKGDWVGTRSDAHDGDQADLRIDRGITLRGQVIGEDEKGFKGALVTAVHPIAGKFIETLSRDDGGFILGPLPPADYPVVASSAGLLSAASRADGSGTLRLLLHPPRALAGRVLRGERPVPAVTVELEGYQHRTAITDASGRFRFEDLTPGRYTAKAREGGGIAVGSALLKAEVPPDELVLRLEAGAAVEGIVSDEEGPVTGAEVTLSKDARATTDSAGHYRIEGLAAAAYRGEVEAAGHVTASFKALVAAGETAHADVAMHRAAFVSGVVVQPDGARVEGAEISAAPTTSESYVFGNGKSNMEGAFTVDKLAPGKYALQVEHDGYVSQQLESAAPAQGLRIVLSRGGVIRGKVLDEDGAVADAHVTAAPAKGRQLRSPFHHARTGEHGEFELTGLPDGDWMVTAETGESESEGDVRQGRVTVQIVSADEHAVEIRLGAGSKIRGMVKDAAGKPVADAYIVAMDRDGLDPSAARAKSGPEGAFVLTGLLPRNYQVTAYKEGYGEPAQALNVAPDSAPIELRFKSEGFADGRVVDPGGAPIRKFVLNGKSVEDPDGRIHVAVPESGPLALRIVAAGYVPAMRQFEVEPGKDVDLGDVALNTGRAVRGSVTDAITGAPVAGARVIAQLGEPRDESGDVMLDFFNEQPDGETATDPAGAFTLSYLDDSPVWIMATADGYAPAKVRAEAGQNEVALQLSRGELAGRVFDGAGNPLAGEVAVRDGPWVRTAADGSFEMKGVSAGPHEIVFMQASTQVFPGRTVQVQPQGVTQLELRPDPGSVPLQIHIAGVPMYADLELKGAAGALEAMVQRDGQVAFWVTPGEYTAKLSAAGSEPLVKQLTVTAAGGELELVAPQR